MSLGFVFPGQGSQSPGMLADLARRHDQVRETFDEASGVLGYDLWELCQNGPKERLDATEQTQPAMLTAGVAVWRAWTAAGGPIPEICAGHSLGEYSALVAADSVPFADAVELVALRGRLMQSAVPQGTGAIAAILGLDDATVETVCEDICARLPGQLVVPVNYNGPGQVVVAGHAPAVDALLVAAKAAGARRCVPLPMSVPVHCELMRPAVAGLAERLAATAIASPAIDVVHNADLEQHSKPADICKALTEQLYRPVRWAGVVEAFKSAGVSRVVECGPGKVLAGLTRRIDKSLETYPVFDPDTLDAALEGVTK